MITPFSFPRALALAAWLALPLATAIAQPTLTDLTLFSADSAGTYQDPGGFVGDTRPGNTSNNNLFIRSGTSFVNGPLDATVQPSISLGLGSHSYTFHLASDGGATHSGMNIFFGGSSTPGISVYGLILSSFGSHSFAANSSGTTIGVPSNIHPAGSGSLSFSAGGYTTTLTDYYLEVPSGENLDLVGGANVGPDGLSDWVGGFTLTVVPEPSMSLWVAGLAITAVAGYRKTRKG